MLGKDEHAKRGKKKVKARLEMLYFDRHYMMEINARRKLKLKVKVKENEPRFVGRR